MDRALRALVWRRAGNCCEYCRMPRQFDDTTFEIDHVIAGSHGGPTRASNLCLACFACNSFKGPNLSGRDIKTQKTVALFNPRRPSDTVTSAGMARAWWAGLQLAGRRSRPCGSISTTASPTARS